MPTKKVLHRAGTKGSGTKRTAIKKSATSTPIKGTTATTNTNLTDGMHYLADTLIANGVETMYGVVGIPVTDFARIAQAKGVKYVGMRHEEDAGNAAAAAGYLNGKPGFFLTVSAPGFLNGLPALKEATENGWPCIQLAGSSVRHTVDLQEGEYEGLDQRAYAEPFAKASLRIDKIEDIPLGIERAIRIATSGRPGGVYVDLPDDLMAQTLPKRAANAALHPARHLEPSLIPEQASINEALRLLKKAKYPLIILGKGAAMARAEKEVQEFVKKTDIPYQPMSMAKGLIPDTDEHSTASCRGLALRTADVILVIGARLNWLLSYGKGRQYNKNVKFIQIDIDPSEIGNARYIECPIVGDIKSSMKALLAGLKKQPVRASKKWLAMLKADTEKNNARFGGLETAQTVPMNHQNALGVVNKILSKHRDVIVANDGANSLDGCRDIVDIYKPRHRLDCGTWGVMGVAQPYAIAAAVETGKPVVSISGDCSFGFAGMETETIARFNLPIVTIVLNNGGIYRGDFEALGKSKDPSPLTLDPVAHYEKVGEAFGMQGYYVATPAELEKALKEALASKKPAFINVQLSIHAGKESGHIGNLNPKPLFGPLATAEMVSDAYDVYDGKLQPIK